MPGRSLLQDRLLDSKHCNSSQSFSWLTGESSSVAQLMYIVSGYITAWQQEYMMNMLKINTCME